MTNEAMWIHSDRQILAKTVKSSHKDGLLFRIQRPDGGYTEAVLAKTDANSVTIFCQLVRDEADEWKAEQEAKALSRVLDSGGDVAGGGKGAEDVLVEETIQALENAVQGDRTFQKTCTSDLAAAEARLAALVAERQDVVKLIDALEAALEVYNASEILAETSRSVSDEMGRKGEGGSKEVAGTAHTTAPDEARTTPTQQDGQRAEGNKD